MRIRELFESTLPTMVYHGTASENLSNIMKHGLKPKMNKWFYSNKYQGGSDYKLQPGETQAELADLSTTTNLKQAIMYAEQGGSTGWGGKPGAVVAFKPLPSDRMEQGGFDANEIIFKNVIAPERLEIVWPERLATKKSALLQKAAEKKAYGADKTAQVKEVNKQLKAAGSGFRIKSGSSTTPRIVLVFSSAVPMTYTDSYTGREASESGPWGVLNTNIGTDAFDKFIAQETSRPLKTTNLHDMKKYAWAAFPDARQG